MPDTSNTLRPAPSVIARAVAAMDILVQRDPVEALSVADRHRPTRTGRRTCGRWTSGRPADRNWAGRRRASGGVPAPCRRLATNGPVDHADRPLVARFRISLALALAEVGRTAAALAQLRAAAPDVDAHGRPRLLAQRSLVLLHAGRLREADEAADEPSAAVANGDRLTEARSLVNRGIVRLQAGQLAAAETDLRAAAELADTLDQRLMAARVLHDLALVYARRGEIPRALEAFADAAGTAGAAASPGRTLVNLERDRAECLLLAGLSEEAAESSARAEVLAASYGSAVTEAEAALLLAAALLRTGVTRDALAAAEAGTHGLPTGRAAGLDGLRRLRGPAGPLGRHGHAGRRGRPQAGPPRGPPADPRRAGCH